MDDIKNVFEQVEMDTSKVQDIMDHLDFQADGRIAYSEFLTATMSKREMINKENLRFAFHHFDSDHDGFITAENLFECFHRQGRGITQEDVYKMMEDCSYDKSAKLNLEEFEKFMCQIDEDAALMRDDEMNDD